MALKLIISRKGERINRRRRFKVFINDKEAGIIRNSEVQEYELEPKHTRLNVKSTGQEATLILLS